MIEFIEKEPWTDTNPFIGKDYVPVYMVKDGVEYFVINRLAKVTGDSLYASQANARMSTAKTMLMQNGGRYFKFYGIYDDPADMLKEMQERGHTFTEPDSLFDKHDDEYYGGGFTDFHGNRNEVSAAFHYRIYDNELAEALKNQASVLIDRKGDGHEQVDETADTGA